MATFDDYQNEIAPATSLRGAPPKTGWAGNGVHER
jgi:hypothetical protein